MERARLSIAMDIRAGFLGKDPEVRITPNGKTVTEFSVSSSYKKGDGYETEWSDVKCFGQTAEWVGANLKKGNLVYVVGTHRTDVYETKDGGKGRRSYTIADSVKLIDDNTRKSTGDDLDKASPPASKATNNPSHQPDTSAPTSDDLPF
jgi:single-strand DNA-binding protein